MARTDDAFTLVCPDRESVGASTTHSVVWPATGVKQGGPKMQERAPCIALMFLGYG